MKIILILIFILIFVLMFNKNNFSSSNIADSVYNKESLYNGSKWNNYRIGDVILMSPYDKFYKPNYRENILYHTQEYPGSIAAEYIKRNKSSKKFQNFKLLHKILNERSPNQEPVRDNTLILHMRVGDVLCKKIWTDNGPLKYAKKGDTDWWNSVIDYIKQNNITEVVIIAGTHFKDCLQESYDYIMDRSDFLKNSGKGTLKVSYRLGQSPDDDIIFCKGAKHFITTGGGFGKLILNINKNNK